MIENQNTAAGRGHVRAVFSGRCRGHAVPLDLVRAHLRAVARMALRARLADEFRGYLVTDCPDDAALRRLEIYGRKYASKAPFSKRRALHSMCLDRIATTGAVSRLLAVVSMHGGPDDSHLAGWHLDAPEYIAAGAMRRTGDEFAGVFKAPVLWAREVRS